MAGHIFFELGAGVGMPLASVLGPLRAAGLWSAAATAAWRSAASRPSSSDAFFATLNGLALSAVLGHLTGWPTRRTRLGLPWLEDCEGLGPELMPYYNSILYISGTAATLAICRENRTAPARLPLQLAVALAPAFAWAQHIEHRRLAGQAIDQPAWWNRRLSR